MNEQNQVAVLLTTHVLTSKRRAGFHWIADSLWRRGWTVYFVTGLSMFDWLKQDYRFEYVRAGEVNRPIEVASNLYSYIWLGLWRPANLRLNLLNQIASMPFELYRWRRLGRLRSIVRRANLVIHESSAEIMLFARLRRINPSARFVYRVSDDLRVLRANPVVLRAEMNAIREFDLVSVATEENYQRFSPFAHCRLHAHGVPAALYDEERNNPYQSGTINAVFSGNNQVDTSFFAFAGKLFPEIRFHVIGPITGLPSLPNIVSYGELPFIETVRFVKFADFGVNPLLTKSFGEGNKMIQYTYCHLPIVSSSLNLTSKPHVFYYEVGNALSIKDAIIRARCFERSAVPAEDVQSWDGLTNALLSD